MKNLITVVCIALLSVASTASAATLFATDFDSATLGAYADGTTINNGGVTTDDLLVAVPAAPDQIAEVIDQGGGNQALQFTDNSTTNFNGPRATNTFATTSSGVIYGQIDVTALAVTVGARSNLAIQITDGGTGPASVLDINILGSGVVQVKGGNGTPVGAGIWEGVATQNALTMNLGDTYRFSFEIDLSAPRDNGTITITNLANAADTATVNWNTRLIDGSVDTLLLNNGANTGAASSDPSQIVDNIIIQTTPIPEPATMALLGLGAVLTVKRRG